MLIINNKRYKNKTLFSDLALGDFFFLKNRASLFQRVMGIGKDNNQAVDLNWGYIVEIPNATEVEYVDCVEMTLVK